MKRQFIPRFARWLLVSIAAFAWAAHAQETTNKKATTDSISAGSTEKGKTLRGKKAWNPSSPASGNSPGKETGSGHGPRPIEPGEREKGKKGGASAQKKDDRKINSTAETREKSQ